MSNGRICDLCGGSFEVTRSKGKIHGVTVKYDECLDCSNWLSEYQRRERLIELFEIDCSDREEKVEWGNATKNETLCYIAHRWADIEFERGKECLQDFGYADMVKAAKDFIACYSKAGDFLTHVEICFEKLVDEYRGKRVEWTKEFFDQCYLERCFSGK